MAPRKTQKPFNSQITAPWVEPVTSEQTDSSSLIPLEQIHLPSEQPRRYFDEAALQKLVASIKQHGILQPLLVRPLKSGGYELVAGERRYRAAKVAELKEVPVVIRDLNDTDALQVTLIENLQREDLNPVEETEGILQLLSVRLSLEVPDVSSLLYRLNNEAAGLVNHNVMVNSEATPNHNVMANSEETPNHNVMVKSEEMTVIEFVFNSLARMGWESFVKNRLPLLKLPEEILEALRSGQIAYTKAQAIARVKDEQARQTLLEEAITQKLSLSQIKERIQSLSPQPKSEDESLPNRLKVAYQQIRKSKVWQNPKKRKQLEKLLTQLEALSKEEEKN
ncbi:Chromosome (plasmid) partitioning protein ParB / Stage 0 sporulation protein J [Crocosphaera watsonii WH 0402]|uniref:Chromosome (Plasmid) partitioning protein ParB / Stage 0 sporulation protein J n=2 Tax=Crocosphaera watsonii TaxID=263511 RepID=T2JZE2_CROWT|nr:ParB/RepB/Spo0J family partition protein [Crocosphaera watsonii]CCQ58224.1 Chromosome (plasmid) partitioning protein ParB / Stage 0 sporulation protein J [Crocosphaera watsonii WH 0005]CCQ70411.1 Chromosome (plasmid) partitioning protein ParB / Stage 0 sporulation protein J [Crocosphaera watsonii WH 0402]